MCVYVCVSMLCGVNEQRQPLSCTDLVVLRTVPLNSPTPPLGDLLAPPLGDLLALPLGDLLVAAAAEADLLLNQLCLSHLQNCLQKGSTTS